MENKATNIQPVRFSSFFWGGVVVQVRILMRMVILFVDLFPQVLGHFGPYREKTYGHNWTSLGGLQTSSIQDRTKALEQQESVELDWF